VDQTPPALLNIAQDTVMACDGTDQQNKIQQWLERHGSAQASDVGSVINWTHNYSGLSDGCGATGSAIVQFTATDECGNSVTTSATISMVDLVAPSFTLLAQNQTLECTGTGQQNEIQLWLDSHGGAQADDGCSNITWTHNFTGKLD
jgi:hypothetical protein